MWSPIYLLPVFLVLLLTHPSRGIEADDGPVVDGSDIPLPPAESSKETLADGEMEPSCSPSSLRT